MWIDKYGFADRVHHFGVGFTFFFFARTMFVDRTVCVLFFATITGNVYWAVVNT